MLRLIHVNILLSSSNNLQLFLHYVCLYVHIFLVPKQLSLFLTSRHICMHVLFSGIELLEFSTKWQFAKWLSVQTLYYANVCRLMSVSLMPVSLISQMFFAKCLSAKSLIAKCLLAKYLLAKYLSAKMSFAQMVLTKCLTAKCRQPNAASQMPPAKCLVSPKYPSAKLFSTKRHGAISAFPPQSWPLTKPQKSLSRLWECHRVHNTALINKKCHF